MEIGNDISSITETLPTHIFTPDHPSGIRPEKYVSFQLGETTYAIQATIVAEVSQQLPITPLPGTPPFLLGISPLRGEILAILDLRAMLCEKPLKSASPKAKEIVLKRATAGATPIAFAVDRLGEIATIAISDIRPMPDSNEILIGEAVSETNTLKVIDHRKLFSSIDPK